MKYSYPLPGSAGRVVEKHLKGAIYDPYIRRLLHDGFGVGSYGNAQARFTNWTEWSNCPTQETEPEVNSSNWLGRAQAVLTSSWRWITGDRDWDDENVCPYAWASAIHKLSCEFPIWPRELEFAPDELVEAEGGRPKPHPDLLELDTPQYAGRLRDEWVVETLVATAGVRLATILNGVVLGVWEPVQIQ